MSAPGALVANSIDPRRRRRRLRLGRAEPLVWIAPAFAVVAFIFGYSMVELVRQSLASRRRCSGRSLLAAVNPSRRLAPSS